ncbi:hypothetical protein FACS189487_07770 [Campylobacterota bacterium]|nr:hypothetical protein FACS189487_07770 [Campylobacterota bacterium]GHV08173.1 hypothetical protein AGMMS50229_16160 [Campylobacterota bacterium]
MADMTDKEYDELDELWTKTTPKVNFARPGVFAKEHILLECLDNISAKYVQNRAEANHKTASQIIGELVREKIAASL